MNYLDFLQQWYNLVFLAAGLGGIALVFWGRVTGSDRFQAAAALLITCVIGLTWNGAIHDLGLGSPALRFPLVLVVSTVAGLLIAWWLARFRKRHLRPVTSVRFNRPGLEGSSARVVTRTVGERPGSGRAQWQDSEGVLNIVHVHTSGGEMGFGRRITLGAFDEESESYLAIPEQKTRRG